MPRIMYWNIENFAIDKLTMYTRKRQFGGAPKYNNDIKGQYILDTVFSTQTGGGSLAPDFFVVLEVSARNNIQGSVLAGAGAEGVQHLLNELQTYNPNWCVVPSLALGAGGQTEGVAVYFAMTDGSLSGRGTGTAR